MHTVIETEAYLSAAKDAGMTEPERKAAVDAVARDPTIGELIVGTGGCRKVRLAGRGKGKSGGYRVITFYADGHTPAFLLTVFSKGERSDLSQAERNGLGVLSKTLAASLGPRSAARR